MSKTFPGDDTSSTHHLADSDDGEGRRSVRDSESRGIDQLRTGGNKYTSNITGQSASGDDSRSSFDGILVKNETMVHVSEHSKN